ncbi:MAG: family 20 glycosylhydrolase [Armatimonadota bacterium]
MIWGNLLHLSYNMWSDRDDPNSELEYIGARPYLRFDEDLWNDLLTRMSDAGMNMVVIDLGDGVRYESHPEIAVEGAWTVDHLKAELAKCRRMGIEPIPKLNFSTTHDAWLGPYSRCVSTDTYYQVCRDLIAEVADIFDNPRFFHLGMDEEKAEYQKQYEYVVVRQHDLWWHDLQFLLDRVQEAGSRPWIWSDYMWDHRDLFLEKMPTSVLQSNWYYEVEFRRDISYVGAYHDLEAYGYDQIPTGSNFGYPENFENMIGYFIDNVPLDRVLGFLQTPWKPTVAAMTQHHIDAIEQVRRAKETFDRRAI